MRSRGYALFFGLLCLGWASLPLLRAEETTPRSITLRNRLTDPGQFNVYQDGHWIGGGPLPRLRHGGYIDRYLVRRWVLNHAKQPRDLAAYKLAIGWASDFESLTFMGKYKEVLTLESIDGRLEFAKRFFGEVADEEFLEVLRNGLEARVGRTAASIYQESISDKNSLLAVLTAQLEPKLKVALENLERDLQTQLTLNKPFCIAAEPRFSKVERDSTGHSRWQANSGDGKDWEIFSPENLYLDKWRLYADLASYRLESTSLFFATQGNIRTEIQVDCFRPTGTPPPSTEEIWEIIGPTLRLVLATEKTLPAPAAKPKQPKIRRTRPRVTSRNRSHEVPPPLKIDPNWGNPARPRRR